MTDLPTVVFKPPADPPIPPFTRWATCGGVSMLLQRGRPIICPHCGLARAELSQPAPPA